MPVPMQPITVPDGPAPPKLRYPERVLSVITRPDLPDTIELPWLAEEAKVPQKALRDDVLRLGRVQRVLAAYGWRLNAGKGRASGTLTRELSLGPTP
jgi:hypothetical protein